MRILRNQTGDSQPVYKLIPADFPACLRPGGMHAVLTAVILLLAAFHTDPLRGGEPGDEWDRVDLEAATEQVNEGQLEFLARPPGKRVLHSDNRITVHPSSLADGWVDIRQCHVQLDPVPNTEIVYRYREIRNLALESSRNIGTVKVAGKSVRLLDVRRGAQLCITAAVRIFMRRPEGGYRIRMGPFHRRFLDGFFPMRVTLEVRFPARLLRFDAVHPKPRDGFSIERAPGTVQADVWFNGMLSLQLDFTASGG